jgi:hypothetical protein
MIDGSAQVRDLLLPGAPVRSSKDPYLLVGPRAAGLLSSHLATSVQGAFDLIVDALTMRALLAQETGADPRRGHVIVTLNLTQKVLCPTYWREGELGREGGRR